MASKNDSKGDNDKTNQITGTLFVVRGDPCPYCHTITPIINRDDVYLDLDCCDKIRQKNEELKLYDADISIKGLDKVAVLKAFWQYSDCVLVFGGQEKFDENKAKQAVNQWIDIFCGREINMDLSGDVTNATFKFHRVIAPAVKIIDELKAKLSTISK